MVIAGHVDAAGFGLWALFRSPIHTSPTGHRHFYHWPPAGTVIGRRVYVKADGFPRTFANTGPARLVLITCGGPFDRTTRNYLDNVVIYAAPTSVNNS
jgi:hypothetical protein